MSLRNPFRTSVAVVLVIPASFMIACSAPDTATSPGTYTLAEFRSLDWLQGDWRGAGGQRPFFESYELVNDSTIRIHYHADSTRSAERGTGRVYYSAGAIYHEADGATWAAVRLDSTGIHFAPQQGARNTFRWTRLSDTTWEAVLRFEDGSEARYEMSRIESALEHNKQLVLRMNAEVWNQANLEAIDELYAPDFVLHFLPDGSETRGTDGLRQHVRDHRAAFPDWSEDITHIVAEGDLVVIHYVSSGTNQGPWLGEPPTGRRVQVHEVSIFRIDEGRIAEQWLLPDLLGLQRQLAGTGAG